MKGYAREAKEKAYTLERCHANEVDRMCEQYHPYKSGPGLSSICYAAKENDRTIAVFAFKPPVIGAAKKYGGILRCDPHTIQCLSRMAAVPRSERITQHISKIMKACIYRMFENNPKYQHVLTFSDSSVGHNGYVYECAGFSKLTESYAEVYHDYQGRRVSKNTSGKRNPQAIMVGSCVLTAWSLKRNKQ